MAFDFPNTPTTGQVITGPGGIQFQWDGVKWVVVNAGSPGFAPINSPQFSGDPQVPTAVYGDNDNSISDTAFVQNAVTPLTHNVGRNFIHNGLYNVQQRGTGPWTSAVYTADRWSSPFSGDTISDSIVALADSDRAAIGDEAAVYAYQRVFTGLATAGSYNMITQHIESIRRLSGKTVTVSFYARVTSGTPKIGIAWYQAFGTGGSPSAGNASNFGTPTLSTTWQRYSVTGVIQSSAGKTFGTTVGTDYTGIEFWLSDGASSFTNRSGGIGQQSGTIQLWGIQVEIGSQATPLEKIDPRFDLANCQRFFYAMSPPGGMGAGWGGVMPASGNNLESTFTFPVTMRATPTATFTAVGTPSGVASIQAYNTSNAATSILMQSNVANTGYGYWNGTITFSADL